MKMDDNTLIADLKERVARFTADRSWERHHSPKNLSMAIAAEAAELMEHFLWDEPAASRERLGDPEQRKAIEEELADILIYCIQFSLTAGIDISTVFNRVMDRNDLRFPVKCWPIL